MTRLRKVLLLLVVLPAALALPTLGRAAAWAPRAATYTVFTQRDVRIPMPDGVKLSADLLIPAVGGVPANGPFPTILTQTPYNKNGLSFASNYLVQRGYVQVIAEVRGTGSSEGIWDSFGETEQNDAVAIVQWIRQQPWFDGHLGLHGTSYAAINQMFLAERTEPEVTEVLKAIFPIVPMSDAYRDITGSGGQINTSFIPSWLGLVTALGLVPPTYVDPERPGGSYIDHANGALAFQGTVVPESVKGGETAFDGPFYRTRSPIEHIDRVHVPTFIVGGWYDLFQRGEPLLFERLQSQGTAVKLLMGPWYHTDPSIAPGLPASGIPYTLDQLELRWMDHYLREAGDPNYDASGPSDLDAVTYNSLGQSSYRSAPTWPPAGYANTTFESKYLSRDVAVGHGSLQTQAPAAQEPDSLVWQPASGVCTRSTVQWTAGDGKGSPCETDNEANDETGLVYETDASGMQIAGPIAAHLFVSTDGADAFITTRVEDVDANGRASQISAGWNVLSLRDLEDSNPNAKTVQGLRVRPYHPFTAPGLSVAANQIYEIWVEIFPTAASLGPGHKLRLSIQTSDAPHLTPPTPQAIALAGGTLKVWHDASHPSSLVIPLAR